MSLYKGNIRGRELNVTELEVETFNVFTEQGRYMGRDTEEIHLWMDLLVGPRVLACINEQVKEDI